MSHPRKASKKEFLFVMKTKQRFKIPQIHPQEILVQKRDRESHAYFSVRRYLFPSTLETNWQVKTIFFLPISLQFWPASNGNIRRCRGGDLLCSVCRALAPL